MFWHDIRLRLTSVIMTKCETIMLSINLDLRIVLKSVPMNLLLSRHISVITLGSIEVSDTEKRSMVWISFNGKVFDLVANFRIVSLLIFVRNQIRDFLIFKKFASLCLFVNFDKFDEWRIFYSMILFISVFASFRTILCSFSSNVCSCS